MATPKKKFLFLVRRGWRAERSEKAAYIVFARTCARDRRRVAADGGGGLLDFRGRTKKVRPTRGASSVPCLIERS